MLPISRPPEKEVESTAGAPLTEKEDKNAQEEENDELSKEEKFKQVLRRKVENGEATEREEDLLSVYERFPENHKVRRLAMKALEGKGEGEELTNEQIAKLSAFSKYPDPEQEEERNKYIENQLGKSSE